MKTVMDAQSQILTAEGRDIDPLLGGIDQATLNAMFSATYEELRRLAAVVRRSDPNASLSPTTLVNEAWLKLSRTPVAGFASKLHFKRLAARAMRQILVEAARKKNALRRGGASIHVTLDDGTVQRDALSGDIISLDEALHELLRINPRHAAMVEARFFGGLDARETAELLGISEATVLRDWRAAKAWLSVELRS